METISKKVRDALIILDNRIIDVDIFFDDLKIIEPEKAVAFQELYRLEENDVLSKVSKGIYLVNKKSTISNKNKPISHRDVIQYYTRKSSGFTIGYNLYNRTNISTQISKTTKILTTRLKKETRTINLITVIKLNTTLNDKTREIIETLEIIENSDTIQDFNSKAFLIYMTNFVKKYDRDIMIQILNDLNYKKQTIYNLDKILNEFGKDSGLDIFLSKTIKYSKSRAYEALTQL